MRSTKIVAVLILSLCCPLAWAADKEDWTAASSVRVMQTVQGRNGMGSGTVIGVDKDGYDVLTCCHVILAWGRAPKRVNGEI